MLSQEEITTLNQESQSIWEQKAGFWDDYVGAEGNQFHRELVAPAVRRLLNIQPDERVLDVACGNGQFTRELAGMGATVLATDFSSVFLERAQKHAETLPAEVASRISYQQVDATDAAALEALGQDGRSTADRLFGQGSPISNADVRQGGWHSWRTDAPLLLGPSAARTAGRCVCSWAHAGWDGRASFLARG